VWSDDDWRGLHREELVIYELHAGTFTQAGTFDALIPCLNRLGELGVTAIELMPVAQFPGARGWGYDGVHLFAVQNSYGGPHGLQRLVNACHRAGLGVILDVVYNHLGPEGNYLPEFGPYFSDRYRTPWGKALNTDDQGCDSVRAFILENVRQWVRDYRVDGLRLDAVHAIFDASPKHILREIREVADEESQRRGRPVHVIAESNLNDVRLLDPPEHGGYGLHGQWSDDFHHSVHTVLTGERGGYYADFGDPQQLVKAWNETFVYDGRYSSFRGRRHGAPAKGHTGDRFVVAIQNHDQVGNRARGDRLATLLDPAAQRLAAGLLLTAPYIPLLFMGEEYGEMQPFLYFCSFEDPGLIEAVRRGRREEFAAFRWPGEVPDPQSEATFLSSRLNWSWPDGTWHAGLRRLYADLLSARRRWPPLRDFRTRSAQLVGQTPRQVMRVLRGGQPPSERHRLIGYFNLTGQGQAVADPGLDAGSLLLMSSESARYFGARDAAAHAVAASDGPLVLLPYEFQLFKVSAEPW
jgi:maltooligosyltrehalose trehalohydrolase